MTDQMTPMDRKVLQEIAKPGSVPDLHWGAAMSVALEWLQGRGYVTRGFRPAITAKGREALAQEAEG